jgi:hypothetical protein
MRVEVLMSPGCAHGVTARALVADVVRESAPGAEVVTVLVGTLAEAERLAFPGSPTIRVDGRDVEPLAPRHVGLG